MRQLDQFEVVSEDKLLGKVKEAIKNSKAFPRLEAAMKKILSDSKELALNARTEVESILSEYGLGSTVNT